MSKEKQTQLDNLYKITLKVGKVEVTATGTTLYEAMENLESPGYFKYKGILIVEYNGKSHQRMLNVVQLRKLTAQKFNKIILAKQILNFLK